MGHTCKAVRHTEPRVRSKPVCLAALVILSVLLVTGFAQVQAESDRKLIRPGRLMIDGLRVKCGETPALVSENYPDFGAAQKGLIILNPSKMRRLPRGVRLLIYYHECAHQYVGGSELAADCWAVQRVRREGLMSRDGLKNACSFIRSLPANRRHPPGEMRCHQMKRCYNETFHENADTAGTPLQVREGNESSSLGFSRPGTAFPAFSAYKIPK